MGRFFGKVGFVSTVETTPGVFVGSDIIERNYYGDITSIRYNMNPNQDSINDDIKLTNQISILADKFIYENLSIIKYVEWMGAKWKVTSIDPSKRPRILLSLGGEYNGE